MIIVIFDGSEVRVMGTRSGFSAAGVFAFALPMKTNECFLLSTRLSPSFPCPLFVFDFLGGGYVDVG